jgi:hypothetical protein
MPNGLKEVAMETVLPAFGAYAATRFLERMAFVQVSKRWPNLGKHAPVVAGLVATAAAYYAGKKITALKKYEQAMLIGTTIALLQTVIQTYLPTFGWVVSDFSAADYQKTLGAPKNTAGVTAKQLVPSPSWSQALVRAPTPAHGYSEDEGLDITPSISGDVEMLDDVDLDLGSLGDGLGASLLDGD